MMSLVESLQVLALFAVPPLLAMLWFTRALRRHPLLDLVPGLGLALWLLPALLVALWALRVVIDVQADPTSHNLLPFEVVAWLAGWIGYAVALRLVLGLSRVGLRLWFGRTGRP